MKPPCDSNDYCPLQRAKRSKVCHTCAWYIKFIGVDPQTGDKMDLWDCSMMMLPKLLIENGRATMSVNDSLDQMRNDNKANSDHLVRASLLRTGALLQVAKK